MSKRGSMFAQGGKMDEDNYQESGRDREEEPAMRATAAQLAARKIKQPKPRASRQNSGVSVPMPAANPFAGLSSFNAPSTPSQSFPQFGNSTNNTNQPAPFAFGASTQQADPPQFGGSFGGSSSFTFGQQPTQPPATNPFGSANSAPNPFASNTPAASAIDQPGNVQQNAGSMFGNTLTNNSNSSSDFNFNSSTPFAGFGTAPQQPAAQEQPKSLFNFGETPSTSNGLAAGTMASSSSFGAPMAPSMLGTNAPASPSLQNTSAFGFGAPPASSGGASKIDWSDPLGQYPTTTVTAQGFGGFGQSTPEPEASAPAQGLFGASTSQTPKPKPHATPMGFSFGTPKTEPQAAPAAPASTPGLFGASTSQSTAAPLFQSTPARDASFSPFKFGNTEGQPAAASTPFSVPSSTAQESSAPASTPSSFGASTAQAQPAATASMFSLGGNTAQAQPATNASIFSLGGSAAQTQPATTSSMFSLGGSTVQPAPEPTAETASTPKPLFSFGKPAKETPSAAPPSTPFKLGGNISQASTTPAAKAPFGFGTSQTTQASTPTTASTPAATPSLFQQSTTASSSTPASKSLFERAAPEALQSPAPASIFGAPSPQPSSEPAPSNTQPPEMPKVPKVFVSDEWRAANTNNASYPPELDDIAKKAAELATQLATLNEQFRAKINKLPALADWSALSSWHFRESTALTQQLTALRKQRAASKGITGHESSLSTKRSAFDPPETPTKRARGDNGPATPFAPRTPQKSTTPEAEPPAKVPDAAPSQASSLFGSLLNKSSSFADQDATPKAASQFDFGSSTEPSKASTQSGGFPFGGQLSKTPANEPSDSAAPSTPFSFATAPKTPATAAAKSTGGFQFGKSAAAISTEAAKDLSKSASQLPNFGGGSSSSVPNFGGSSSSSVPNFGGGSTSAIPNFGASSASSGSNAFLSQFAKKSKTAEELAAERKKKAKDEDYDSDEMTEEEWSAEYDRKEAKRKAEEDAAKAKTPVFTVSAASSVSNGETSSKTPFNFQNPLSGASTPAAVNSRGASPALSVFDEPAAAKSSGSNIFGHLSSGNSSNNQEESDESADEEAEEEEPASGSRSPKRKLNDDGSDSDETLEETMRRKKQDISTPKGGSLLSRMTRDPISDAEAVKPKEGLFSKSVSGATTNGTSTPLFGTFDFANAAGSQSVPPKASTFAGDQTYKEGTPLKFSTTTPSTDSKSAPSLKVQPASPSPSWSFTGAGTAANTSNPFAAKPADAGSNTFSFLNKGASSATTPSFLTPNPGQSTAASNVSSVFSSRAATPLSEQETSAQESANDEDAEEPVEQLNLSALTAQEKAENDILFEHEVTVVKKQFNAPDGTRGWETVARGPVYVLRDKESQRAFVRVKLPSGKCPVQFSVLKGVEAHVMGQKGSMVSVPFHNEGRLSNYLFTFKEKSVAEGFKAGFMGARPA